MIALTLSYRRVLTLTGFDRLSLSAADDC